MIQFDEHIFQMGWFNHQVVMRYFTVSFGVKVFPVLEVIYSQPSSAVEAVTGGFPRGM